MKHCKVIIVGGGPAGSSVAHSLLADGTHGSLLIERLDEAGFSKYNRMCAEGISRQGLAEEGIEPAGIQRNVINKATEHWPGGVTIASDIDGSIIDRVKLISWLRRPFIAGGGEVIRSKVLKVRHLGDRFIVECSDSTYSCDFIVGADGAHSVVRKQIFGTEPIVKMRVVQYLVDRPMENELLFFFDEKYHGKYRWEFPSDRYTKVGFPEGTDEAPVGAIEVHKKSIPIGGLEKIVKGRACLVGDAACQANPVTFSGIRNSLAAGRLAAGAINRGELEEYELLWKRSPLADTAFWESFFRMSRKSNEELGRLVEPFRFGPNLIAIMGGLMNNDDFRAFYLSHVRKMKYGW